MSRGDHPGVRRVEEALRARGSSAPIIELESTARSAEDAAAALGVELGAIVKSLVFEIGRRPAMALVAGDRRCDPEALARALGLDGRVRRADADMVRAATGFSIGGVAPIGHGLPVAIDASLGRFDTVYAAAGHPFCVFATSIEELAGLTGGPIAEDLGRP